MRQVLVITTVIFICGFFGNNQARAEHCRGNTPACEKLDADARENVSLRIYRNFVVVVEGQFGDGQERQNFMLDTGTAPTIVHSRLVKKLGLRPTPSIMSVIGRDILAQSAVLPELDLGPIRAVSLRVQLQDLSPLEQDLGIPVAGIIGLDVLAQCNFRIDYDKKRLAFGDVPKEGIPVGFDARTGIAVAYVRIDGKPRRMLVDTGSDQVALFAANFREIAGAELHVTSQEGVSVADRSVPVRVVLSPDIVLGNQHFTVRKAYYIAGSAEPEFDGLLGVRALGFRAIAYDRERESIYLQK